MVTICIGSKSRRHRTGSAAGHGWFPAGSSPPHCHSPCEMNTNALPSPPAMPVKHTPSSPAPATCSWRSPSLRPPIHGAGNRQPPFRAKVCVSTALRHPDCPAESPDRPAAVRARSDCGAGRRRLVAVRPAHSYWAGAGWCLGPLRAVFLQMSRRPAYSKTSRQPAPWRRRALPQTSHRPG